MIDWPPVLFIIDCITVVTEAPTFEPGTTIFMDLVLRNTTTRPGVYPAGSDTRKMEEYLVLLACIVLDMYGMLCR